MVLVGLGFDYDRELSFQLLEGEEKLVERGEDLIFSSSVVVGKEFIIGIRPFFKTLG